jgi:hypothetical protein
MFLAIETLNFGKKLYETGRKDVLIVVADGTPDLRDI